MGFRSIQIPEGSGLERSGVDVRFLFIFHPFLDLGTGSSPHGPE